MVDGVVTLPSPPRPTKRVFARGERVRIVAGPLAGFNGLHSGLTHHEREVILLVLLGAERQVMIASGLVAPR
jgi:transcription antitermination factor NusG